MQALFEFTLKIGFASSGDFFSLDIILREKSMNQPHRCMHLCGLFFVINSGENKLRRGEFL